jgi:hypothetical protein
MFYDQPDEPSRWHIERIHLLGQSWGGWLAIEYMLGAAYRDRQPDPGQHVGEHSPVRRRVRTTQERAAREVYATLQKYEAARDYRHPAYEKAAELFYRRGQAGPPGSAVDQHVAPGRGRGLARDARR